MIIRDILSVLLFLVSIFLIVLGIKDDEKAMLITGIVLFIVSFVIFFRLFPSNMKLSA